MTGSLSAVSSATGGMAALRGLAGSITGASTVSGLLVSPGDLVGLVHATTSVTGSLSVLRGLAGSVTSTSSTAAALASYSMLHGSVTGASTAAGDLSLVVLPRLNVGRGGVRTARATTGPETTAPATVGGARAFRMSPGGRAQ
jgi:hypothetical protein